MSNSTTQARTLRRVHVHNVAAPIEKSQPRKRRPPTLKLPARSASPVTLAGMPPRDIHELLSKLRQAKQEAEERKLTRQTRFELKSACAGNASAEIKEMTEDLVNLVLARYEALPHPEKGYRQHQSKVVRGFLESREFDSTLEDRSARGAIFYALNLMLDEIVKVQPDAESLALKEELKGFTGSVKPEGRRKALAVLERNRITPSVRRAHAQALIKNVLGQLGNLEEKDLEQLFKATQYFVPGKPNATRAAFGRALRKELAALKFNNRPAARLAREQFFTGLKGFYGDLTRIRNLNIKARRAPELPVLTDELAPTLKSQAKMKTETIANLENSVVNLVAAHVNGSGAAGRDSSRPADGVRKGTVAALKMVNKLKSARLTPEAAADALASLYNPQRAPKTPAAQILLQEESFPKDAAARRQCVATLKAMLEQRIPEGLRAQIKAVSSGTEPRRAKRKLIVDLLESPVMNAEKLVGTLRLDQELEALLVLWGQAPVTTLKFARRLADTLHRLDEHIRLNYLEAVESALLGRLPEELRGQVQALVSGHKPFELAKKRSTMLFQTISLIDTMPNKKRGTHATATERQFSKVRALLLTEYRRARYPDLTIEKLVQSVRTKEGRLEALQVLWGRQPDEAMRFAEGLSVLLADAKNDKSEEQVLASIEAGLLAGLADEIAAVYASFSEQAEAQIRESGGEDAFRKARLERLLNPEYVYQGTGKRYGLLVERDEDEKEMISLIEADEEADLEERLLKTPHGELAIGMLQFLRVVKSGEQDEEIAAYAREIAAQAKPSVKQAKRRKAHKAQATETPVQAQEPQVKPQGSRTKNLVKTPSGRSGNGPTVRRVRTVVKAAEQGVQENT